LPILTHGAETWTKTKRDVSTLQQYRQFLQDNKNGKGTKSEMRTIQVLNTFIKYLLFLNVKNN